MTCTDVFQNPKRIYIPGFSLQDEFVSRQVVFPPNGVTDNTWYTLFNKAVLAALNERRYFPIFRSGHGEFLFTLGRLDRPGSPIKLLRYFASRIYNGIKFRSLFYSGTPVYGYETYEFWKIPRLRRRFAEALKIIHREGAHCLYFSDRDACSLKRQAKYMQWLKSKTEFHESMNYWHVYFVYALLLGPESNSLFRNRHVLVVTSNIDRRRHSCADTLTKLGAREIEFSEISRSHAMEDKLKAVSGRHDIALVGGGVGAANILAQLRGYPALSVDAGFALDCFEEPQNRRKRIYCTPDNLWHQYHGSRGPSWAAKFDDCWSQLPPNRLAMVSKEC